MMFYLVKYLEDGILQVVPKVLQRGSTTRAKYYGKYYDAHIIAKNTSCHVLQNINILINIELHLPIVILERMDYMTNAHYEDKDPESQICDFTGILTEPMNLPKYEKFYMNDNSGIEILQDTVYDKTLTMYNEEKDPEFNMSVSPGILVEALTHPIIIPEDGKINMFYHSGSEISQDTMYESTGTHVKNNELIYTVGSSPSIIIQSNEILVAKNTPNLQITCEGVQESSQLVSKSMISPFMENESKCGILNDRDTIQNNKSDDEQNNKKTTQKKHCCFYCQKVLFKIYRNRYLFGVPSNTLTQNTFQACQLIRKFSYESEIENPELLRTRLLRQHLATKTAESHIDQRLEGRVSDFMSHKRHIHEDYYVMTQKTDDITKVSKLLENFSSVHNNTHDSQKSRTSSQLQDPDRASSNEEYIPDENNNNKRSRKSLSHERCLKDESDEEYVPDVNNSSVTQAELDSILGKRQTRRSWNSFEKSLAREFFDDEIINGTIIQRAKVNEFFELNKELYKNQTPHLIMQWVKCQRNAVLAEKAGKKGERIRWSTPEKEVLRNSTERHSSEGTNPTLPECELILEQNKQILKYSNPRSIKSFICTELTKREMD